MFSHASTILRQHFFLGASSSISVTSCRSSARHGGMRALHVTASLSQAKAKGKGPATAAAPAVVEKYDLTTQIPVNLLKEGDEPVYKPDDAYPPWLWTLLNEPPLLDDLAMRGVEKLSQPELKRVIRLTSKKRIKQRNLESEKATEET